MFSVGVDVGTASVRVGVFDVCTGERRGYATRAIETWRPRTDFFNQSSSDIWAAVGEACRAAVAEAVASGIAKTDILGIAFDGTCSLVVLDEDGEPISVSPNGEPDQNIIVWCDHRALSEAEEMTATGHEMLRYVGGVMSPEMQPPKLLYIKRNYPRTWERAGKFFDLCDWLAYAATGRDVRSLCSNVCKWAYDKTQWNDAFFAHVGLGGLVDGRRVVRDIQPPGNRIGCLSSVAAAHLGLNETVSVGVGAIDAHAGGIGVLGEAAAPGTALAMIAGTSVCHMALADKPVYIDGVWGPYLSAMVEGLWLTEGGQSAAGSLIDAAAHSADPAVHERLCDVALLLSTKEKLSDVAQLARHLHVLDFHLGNRSPFADPRARGVIDGVALSPDEDETVRAYVATLCAVAYGTRSIIDALNSSVDANGRRAFSITCLYGTGGLCKNALWLQIVSDATGLPIILRAEPDSVLLGSAILGAVGCGLHKSVSSAMAAMSRKGRVVEPTPAARAFHDKKYDVYKRLYTTHLQNRKTMEAADEVAPLTAPPLSPIVYLDGSFRPAKEARVSVDDRGFLFGDGVYEVTKLFSTKSKGVFIFTEKEHFARLRRGLSELRIDAEEALADLPRILRKLVEANGFTAESFAYIQITRGSASPRAHAWYGGPVRPSVYVCVRPYTFPSDADFQRGASAITLPDQRWSRCDIKSISLLPNILANQRAKEAGAYEALLTRHMDGEAFIVEASHSNVFAVLIDANGNRELVTPPLRNILPGVTRNMIASRGARDAQLLAEAGVSAIRDGPIPLSALNDGRVIELIVTASTSFVVAITSVDEKLIGDGRVGRAATALRSAWVRWWREDLRAFEECAAGGSA